MLIVDEIKERASMEEVVRFYGYTPNRSGFVCCPFHEERTPSLKVYETSFYCFGCHVGGDVLTFVQKLYDLTFSQAVVRLNHDFHLGLTAQTPTLRDERQQMAREVRRREQDGWRRAYEAAYQTHIDARKRLLLALRDRRPRRAEDFVDPLWLEAVHQWDNLEAWFNAYPNDLAWREAHRAGTCDLYKG